jgi:uncharacterized membrane protein YwzB
MIALLFSIDLVWAMQSLNHEMLTPMMDQIRNLGLATQIGKQVVVLSVAIIIGYSLALFWSRITRWIG